MHILYLHGFRSSPNSHKAKATAKAVTARDPNGTWACPALPPSPRQAMAEVLDSTKNWPRHAMAVIGSSLGGFYATWLAEQLGCKAVLLNPAVRPARYLVEHTGEQTQWHDPEQHFYFHPSFIDELIGLEVTQITRPERYFGVIAKGDEVLDWHEMTEHYRGARIKLLPAGDHATSDYAEEHLDDVLNFLFPTSGPARS